MSRTRSSRPWRPISGLAALALVAAGCGDGDESGDGAQPGSGGLGSGAQGTGGFTTGGALTGGFVGTGATAPGTGGGPASGGSAGAPVGGVSTGGLATGGLATGGLATGGLATGGLATGGLATGGLATGGLATGGTTTGGAGATGGTSAGGGGGNGGEPTGGAATGGAATGGASAGGASGGACASRPRLDPSGAPLDCGAQGIVFEAAGSPDNRVNFVILGDGYTAALLDTLYVAHIENMLYGEDGFYSELSDTYVRYAEFINVCALRVVSNDACIDDEDTGQLCDTALGGSGDDASRLGVVERSLVNDAVATLLPAAIDVDWTAVTINAGASNWWNSGGSVMVWNGSFTPQNRAASVALHEGGHAFHRLADEYDGTSSNCSNAPEVNVTTDGTGAKWAEWLGFDHVPGTGLHGAFEGARYCNSGIWRPTDNSQMNLLPDDFNMPSVQKMVHDIYAIVRPFDATTPTGAPLVAPEVLEVRVVDPAVLKVEWSVDGAMVTADGGECFDATGLAPGSHTVTARAYDDTPWVRNGRADLEQSVTWTVTIP